MTAAATHRDQALGSVRVLDLTRVLAGPWATQILADLGAEVIKIERPEIGDECRHWGPPWIEDHDGRSTAESAYFMGANRNKQSVAVDIANPEGSEIVRQLLQSSDIFVENFKVGSLQKYGLDYEAVRRQRPDIIYLSLTGFGQQGPYADRPGYDYLFQGLVGLMNVTGDADDQPGGGPQRIGIPLVDMFTGMYAAVALLAALRHRERTGEGQYIDLSLFDTAMALGTNPLIYSLVDGRPQGRSGRFSPTIAPYGVFPTRDGLLIVASANQSQWVNLCGVLDRPDMATNPEFATNADRIKNQARLNQWLADVFRSRSRADWESALTKAGIPAGPVNDPVQAMEHPQAMFNRSVSFLAHTLGGKVPTVASPLKLARTPVAYRTAPPLLGEHTDDVLTRELCFSEEALRKLHSAGVIQRAEASHWPSPGSPDAFVSPLDPA